VFTSSSRLTEDIGRLLAAMRGMVDGRYACVVESSGVLFEEPEPEDRESWALRRLLDERSAMLFEIPKGMESGAPMQDVFEGWDHDELFLAFINERVAILLACPDAESAKERLREPLFALADRLLRYNESYRIDSKGRGLLFGSPKLDLIVIGRADG
jgi:hypothetical protein